MTGTARTGARVARLRLPAALTALPILPALAVSPLLAQTAEAILQRAERAYHASATFRARFVQTIENPMLGGPEESRGMIYLAPPNRFAMRFVEPAGDRIVADGAWLWIYAPSSVDDQVIRQPIPREGAFTPNLVAQFVDRPLERYEATFLRGDTVAGQAVDVVRLVPRGAEMPFRRADIAVESHSGLLRRIALVEASGQHRTIVFHEIHTGAAIPEREFRFDVPAGVRVVTP